MRLFLTRQSAGDYMLTAFEPVLHEVVGTGRPDAYVREGDPIGLRHLCARGVRVAIGTDLPRLVPTPVDFSMKLVEEDKQC